MIDQIEKRSGQEIYSSFELQRIQPYLVLNDMARRYCERDKIDYQKLLLNYFRSREAELAVFSPKENKYRHVVDQQREFLVSDDPVYTSQFVNLERKDKRMYKFAFDIENCIGGWREENPGEDAVKKMFLFARGFFSLLAKLKKELDAKIIIWSGITREQISDMFADFPTINHYIDYTISGENYRSFGGQRYTSKGYDVHDRLSKMELDGLPGYGFSGSNGPLSRLGGKYPNQIGTFVLTDDVVCPFYKPIQNLSEQRVPHLTERMERDRKSYPNARPRNDVVFMRSPSWLTLFPLPDSDPESMIRNEADYLIDFELLMKELVIKSKLLHRNQLRNEKRRKYSV